MLTEHTKRQVCLYRKIQKSIIFITALCFKVTYSMPLFLYCSRHVTHTSREVFCLLNKTKGNFFVKGSVTDHQMDQTPLCKPLQTMINIAGFSVLFTLLEGSRCFVHGQDAGNTGILTGGGFGLVSMFVIFVFCLCGTYLCVSFTCCYEYFCQPDENSSECCSCRRSSDEGLQQKTADELTI